MQNKKLTLEERLQLADKFNPKIRKDLYSFMFNNPSYNARYFDRDDDELRHELLDELEIPRYAK